MKDVGKLKPLSAFEWASVSQYVVYISNITGLKDFSSNDLISFPLARMGPVKLVARKVRVLAALEENKECLERFVGRHEEELGDNEMSVLRSMYLQFKRSAEAVEEHIRIARQFAEAEAPGTLLELEKMENDLPF